MSEKFERLLDDVLNKHAPLRVAKDASDQIKKDPWITMAILKSGHTCQKLYKKSIKKRCNRERYKTI